jgi:dienelactone hydrolase
LPAPVDIPGSGLTLHAQLYKPEGDGPFPTVIALHGCGGLGGPSEPVQSRYREWAEQLLKAGHAVLLPDSYGSRELGPQCRVKERRVLARRERVADVNASRQWLLQQPWAARDRISLIGWAHGASAVLWAVRPQSSARGIEPDFRSAIAFYPDCRISSGLGWSTRVPTLLLIGAQDDVSSPAACRQVVEGARGRSALAQIVVYPGAPHDFDRANLPLRAIAGSDAALPERGHIGTDADARKDSQRRVTEWLAR